MTKNKLPSVSVGLLVYNEEETVREVLRETHQLLSESGIEYEILVCDDGSTDSSGEIVHDAVSRFPNFRVIKHPKNMGIAAALESIYKNASMDFVFINSVDKQWDTAILFDMLPLTTRGDIVVASRKKKSYSLGRRFISWGFNFTPQVLFGVRTYDAGSVKLIKREIIERFPLVSRSPFSEAERLILAHRAGYRIIDYPVRVSPRKTGRSHAIKFKVLFDALTDIVRVWRSIHFRNKAKNV